MTFAVFGVSCALHFLADSHFVAMAEPNINEPTEPTEPTEPERSETETDASSTSSGDGQDVGPPDSHDTPVVYVEPPLTQAHPPIFYIPIPSPGDPVPLIPTKAFVVGPVEPIPAKPKSVFFVGLCHSINLRGSTDWTKPSDTTGIRLSSGPDGLRRGNPCNSC